MMTTTRWQSLLRVLTYGVLQNVDPMDGAANAARIASEGALNATKEEYLEAIRIGLASDVDLAELYPLNHSDATCRAFLRAVEADLLARPSLAGQPMTRTRWAFILRMLTDVMMTSADPMDAVADAARIARQGARNATKEDFLEAIDRGLASDVDLAKIYILKQSNETARAFLRAVAAALTAG